MLAFFISIAGYAFMCVSPQLTCASMPVGALAAAIVAGSVELTFEIVGVIKLYRLKDKDEDK